ncbi:DMT family transporter [Miniphocaeibacter massiliensis]|uniref:DMT family transporter n=1 Tax=Miniphocaeibacter massiliensis TaxID=2041841 RepID=UPI000C1C08AC|nr:DMT family transporter [Miniphocaeibacter massiliensis]
MDIVLDRKKGILFMLISCFWFAAMQMFVKLSGNSIPLFEQVFFRNLVTLFLCGFLCFKNNVRFFGTKESRPYLYLRSILGYLGVVLNFYAINNMNTADATILQKSSPIFVIIFSVIFLKEKLTKTNIITLILCFIGAIFVVRPQFNSTVIPAVAGLASAGFAGGAYTVLAYVNKMEDSNTIIFFFSLVSSIITIPFLFIDFVTPTFIQFLSLIGIGIFAGLGQIFLTLSYKYALATDVSIYNYATIIFTSIMGYFIFGEILNIFSVVGIVLIFSSSYYQYKRR